MKRFDVSELLETNEVDELKKRINELLRVIKAGETVELIDHGEIITRMRPESEEKQSRKQRDAAAWEDLKRIASELAPYWADENVDAVEIVHDVRRDL